MNCNFFNFNESLEVWRDIKGYEGLYQVSNFGRVKSLEHLRKSSYDSFSIVPERILSPIKMKNGYLFVNLYKDEHSKHFLIHRLVAEAFLPNPNDYPIINHKNPQEKDNNHVSNLEWCTYQYNAIYDNAHVKRGEKLKGKHNLKNRILLGKQVGQYDKNTMQLISIFPSTIEAQRILGINRKTIVACCNGKLEYYKDFTFKFLPKESEK